MNMPGMTAKQGINILQKTLNMVQYERRTIGLQQEYGSIILNLPFVLRRERDNIIFKRGIQHLGSRKTRKMRRTYQYVISSRQRQTENKST